MLLFMGDIAWSTNTKTQALKNNADQKYSTKFYLLCQILCCYSLHNYLPLCSSGRPSTFGTLIFINFISPPASYGCKLNDNNCMGALLLLFVLSDTSSNSHY